MHVHVHAYVHVRVHVHVRMRTEGPLYRYPHMRREAGGRGHVYIRKVSGGMATPDVGVTPDADKYIFPVLKYLQSVHEV